MCKNTRKNKMKKPMICKLFSILSEKTTTYFENTSIHGLRYTINKESHWIERLFWLGVCVLSFVGTYFLFVATWTNYQKGPISFVAETSYLNWNTTFPAVAICESLPDDSKVAAFVEAILGEDGMKYVKYFKETLYYKNCDTCPFCKTIDCPDNVTYIMTWIQQFKTPCHQLLSDCSYDGEPFDCCSYFHPLETQIGTCYTINSKQTEWYHKEMKRNRKLKLISNRHSGPGVLKIHCNENVEFFMHSAEDVPTIYKTSSGTHRVIWGQKFNITFQMTEIMNDPLLPEVPLQQRDCRLPDEPLPNSFYPSYGYSTCIGECFVQEQMKLCGCIHHLTPGVDLKVACNVSGRSCLDRHLDHFSSVRSPSDPEDRRGVYCACAPSCNEPEMRTVHTVVSNNDGSDEIRSEITIKMAALPSMRFVRNVVRTKLDLVVSLGSAGGLFLGASLLSIVEFIYYFFMREKEQPPAIKLRMAKPVTPTKAKAAKDEFARERQAGFQWDAQPPYYPKQPPYYPKDYLSTNNLFF